MERTCNVAIQTGYLFIYLNAGRERERERKDVETQQTTREKGGKKEKKGGRNTRAFLGSPPPSDCLILFWNVF